VSRRHRRDLRRADDHDRRRGHAVESDAEILAVQEVRTTERHRGSTGDEAHARGNRCYHRRERLTLGEVLVVGVVLVARGAFGQAFGRCDMVLGATRARGGVGRRADAASRARRAGPVERGRGGVGDVLARRADRPGSAGRIGIGGVDGGESLGSTGSAGPVGRRRGIIGGMLPRRTIRPGCAGGVVGRVGSRVSRRAGAAHTIVRCAGKSTCVIPLGAGGPGRARYAAIQSIEGAGSTISAGGGIRRGGVRPGHARETGPIGRRAARVHDVRARNAVRQSGASGRVAGR